MPRACLMNQFHGRGPGRCLALLWLDYLLYLQSFVDKIGMLIHPCAARGAPSGHLVRKAAEQSNRLLCFSRFLTSRNSFHLHVSQFTSAGRCLGLT